MFRSRIALSAATFLGLLSHVAAADVTPAESRPTRSSEHSNTADADGPLSEYRIVSVTPYLQEVRPIKTTWKELRGAVIRIEAQPCLTSQWLQLRLDRQIASPMSDGSQANDGPLAIPGIRATVSPLADGFVVTVSTTDKDAAKEVLRRALALESRQRR